MRRDLTLLKLCGIVLPLVAVLSGCSRDSVSPQPQPVVLEVITNATEIAAAKQQYTEQREVRLKKFLNYPSAIRRYDRECMALMREQPQRSIEALINLRDSTATPVKTRIQAIRALTILEVPPSEEQLLQLARTDADTTMTLLTELLGTDSLYPDGKPLPDVLKRFVLECLGSGKPRIVVQAANVAAWHNLHEAGETLARLVQQQSSPDLALLKAAARLYPSSELLRKVEPELKHADLLENNGALGAVADLAIAATEPALKAAAVETCARHLKQQRDLPFIDDSTTAAVNAVAKALPPEKAKAILSDLVRSGKWRYMREAALAELARINATSARSLAKQTRLDLPDNQDATTISPKRTGAELADVCLRHGLLTQNEVDAAMRKLANPPRVEDGSGPGPDCAEGLFYAADRFITFDVETGESPNRHDLLLQHFAQSSAGLFRPEAVLEDYEGPRSNAATGKYTVQFIMGDRLYRFQPNDLGDWYDVEAVIPAIHQALEDAGMTERFVPLESDGQIARFVFAKPDGLLAAAAELGLSIGRDLDEARQLGKGAETRMFRELRK